LPCADGCQLRSHTPPGERGREPRRAALFRSAQFGDLEQGGPRRESGIARTSRRRLLDAAARTSRRFAGRFSSYWPLKEEAVMAEHDKRSARRDCAVPRRADLAPELRDFRPRYGWPSPGSRHRAAHRAVRLLEGPSAWFARRTRLAMSGFNWSRTGNGDGLVVARNDFVDNASDILGAVARVSDRIRTARHHVHGDVQIRTNPMVETTRIRRMPPEKSAAMS
jgi:hypothetical protein